jgi:hypothetical protein
MMKLQKCAFFLELGVVSNNYQSLYFYLSIIMYASVSISITILMSLLFIMLPNFIYTFLCLPVSVILCLLPLPSTIHTVRYTPSGPLPHPPSVHLGDL